MGVLIVCVLHTVSSSFIQGHVKHRCARSLEPGGGYRFWPLRGGPKFSKQGGSGGSKNFPPTVESTEISRFPIVYDTADYIYDAHFL